MPSYTFNAKYGLLTYAQCGSLDPFAVVNHLSGLGAECIVGRESHADGGIHLHAFFMFERQRNFRRTDVFDVDGRHPNILRGRQSPEKMWDYATKDGDIVGGGLGRPCRKELPTASSVWDTIILCDTREEFFETCAELAPRALLTSFTSLRAYAEWRYRVEPTPYEHPKEAIFSTSQFPQLDGFVQQSLKGNQCGKFSGLSRDRRAFTSMLFAFGDVYATSPGPLPPLRSGRQSAEGS